MMEAVILIVEQPRLQVNMYLQKSGRNTTICERLFQTHAPLH